MVQLDFLLSKQLKQQEQLLLLQSSLSKERQELAKLAGADYVLNPATQDVLAEIRNLTNGLGVNVSL